MDSPGSPSCGSGLSLSSEADLDCPEADSDCPEADSDCPEAPELGDEARSPLPADRARAGGESRSPVSSGRARARRWARSRLQSSSQRPVVTSRWEAKWRRSASVDMSRMARSDTGDGEGRVADREGRRGVLLILAVDRERFVERIVRGDDNRIGVLPSTCHTLLHMRILCVGIPVGLLAALTTINP